MLQLMNRKSFKTAEKMSDYIANSITEFKYEPVKVIIFVVYNRRYEQICKDRDDDMKTRLILRKRVAGEQESYSHYLLLKKIFGHKLKIYIRHSEKSTLFDTRW